VEADIFLVDGELLVAHTRAEIKPGRTLQSLYLDPLRERARRNGGRIYRGGPDFILLIDYKTPGPETHVKVREVLSRYPDLFTRFRENGAVDRRAVTAVLTGNRPRGIVEAERDRNWALDGDLADLDTPVSAPPALVPQVSASWFSRFKWLGLGAIPEEERQRLRDIVTRAHSRGYRVRFWGAPDAESFWKELLAADVDLINTDRLPALRDFLLKNDPAIQRLPPRPRRRGIPEDP
jgi:glycerophosphoryl diester phosphodiesterase